MPLSAGTILCDRYRILAELGRGGMGAVYQAHDDSLGLDVALKENLFVSPAFAEAFEREARLLAGLRHPSLPRVTDHFVLPGQGQYLVMDFVAGEDLRQRLLRQGGPLPEAHVVRWARDILGALEYLHAREKPIIHRDIKPGNLKLTDEGRIMLVDFGLAKVSDAALSTIPGVKALTPGFSPPEQYGTGPSTPASDIYSLGATLYNLLGGQAPVDALQRALGQVTLVSLASLNPQLSPRVVHVVERCLALQPGARYASAAAMLAALQPNAPAHPPAPPAPVLPRSAAPQAVTLASPVAPAALAGAAPPRRRGCLTGAVLAGLLVAGIGAGLTLMLGYNYFRPGLIGPSATDTPALTARAATETPAAPSVVPSATAAAPTAGATATVPSTLAASETPPPDETATEAPSAAPVLTSIGGGAGVIAFASERNGAPQIFTIDDAGGSLTQLTDVAEGACQPAWSPDGTQLLFVTPCAGKADRYPASAIYVMDAAGGPSRPLIAMLGGAYEPDWSAAGIVFTHLENGRPQLYRAAADGTGLQRLSATNSGDIQASWAPGGVRLAFGNFSRSGQNTIYWMLPDGTFARGGSNPEAVTRGVEASSAAWSPDDRWVVYVTGQQLVLIDWTARGFGAQVLSAEGPNADPAWSPDAQWVVFESWRERAVHDLYRIAVTGGAVVRLTNDTALDYHPAWQPQ